MSNVGNVTLLSPNSASSAASSSSGSNTTLTQADFLQLMVAQFQAQDPLASGDSSDSSSGSGAADYVNQLMSMTNLTTMQNMSQQQGILMAQGLPGATVTITTPSDTTVTGIVTGTTIDPTNGVSVTVNGTVYPSNEITSLTPASYTAATSGTGTGTTSN